VSRRPLAIAALLALAACGPSDFEHYRGAIHEHSGYSDRRSGLDAEHLLRGRRRRGLDFLGSAEHSDSEDIPVTFSEECLAVPDIAGCAIADPDSPANSFRKWEASDEQAKVATTPASPRSAASSGPPTASVTSTSTSRARW
jgi:hypothetical protein